MGLDGLNVHAVSDWITLDQVINTIAMISGTEVKFQEVPEAVFRSLLPKAVAKEMTENMVLVRFWKKGRKRNRVRVTRCLKGVV